MTQLKTKVSLLFITKGMFYSLDSVDKGRFGFLKDDYTGYLIQRVADKKHKRVQLDGFELYGCYIPALIAKSDVFSNIYYFFHSLLTCLLIYYTKQTKFEVIISRNPLSSGLVAMLVAFLTGTKLIVEMNGNFSSKIIWSKEISTLKGRMKFYLTQLIVPVVLKSADGIKLLYPSQIDTYKWIGIKGEIFIFHCYVPVSALKASELLGQYVLFLGYPWDVKGVDVLIKAFNSISDKIPAGVYLRIIGYFPEADLSMLTNLAGGNPKICIEKAVFHKQAMEIMANARVVVLPSRTEAMGRVLLEAMAQKRPIVASCVDGIPTYVKHGETGLLVEPEDDNALGQAICTLLNDEFYARQLAQNAWSHVNAELTEKKYIEKYYTMIQSVF